MAREQAYHWLAADGARAHLLCYDSLQWLCCVVISHNAQWTTLPWHASRAQAGRLPFPKELLFRTSINSCRSNYTTIR